MTTMIVRHRVADFDTWKPAYDDHEASRREHGCQSAAVLRDPADGNDVTIVMTYPSAAAAQAFLDDPSLAEAMSRAGVTGPPEIRLLDETETLVYEGVR
jgi:quinol monooxygenase YgiN